jgi:hypothetical protein
MYAIAAFIPPVMWVIHLAIVRTSVFHCGEAGSAAHYGAAFVLLAITVASGLWAWRGYRRTIDKPKDAREMISARYFGLVGIFGSIIFGTGIVIQAALLYRYC